MLTVAKRKPTVECWNASARNGRVALARRCWSSIGSGTEMRETKRNATRAFCRHRMSPEQCIKSQEFAAHRKEVDDVEENVDQHELESEEEKGIMLVHSVNVERQPDECTERLVRGGDECSGHLARGNAPVHEQQPCNRQTSPRPRHMAPAMERRVHLPAHPGVGNGKRAWSNVNRKRHLGMWRSCQRSVQRGGGRSAAAI